MVGIPASTTPACAAPSIPTADPDLANPERRIALDPAVAAGISSAARDRRRLLDRVEGLGLQVMILDDADYPPLLLTLESPPPVLFVRGSRTLLSALAPH